MSIAIPVAPKYVIAKSSNSSGSPMEEFLKFKGVDSPLPSRKRKLDHLSIEEKIQRKKLKNRVAAQTSRDRKKAKMEDMEIRIDAQESEIAVLRKERDTLVERYTKLERRFVDMERRLTEQAEQLKQARLDSDIASRVIGSVTNSSDGSAEGIGSTVNRTKCKTEQQRSSISPVEDNSTLSSLQECLGQIDNAQLEQLTDLLLRDLAATLESDAATADDSVPGSTDRTKVGTHEGTTTRPAFVDVVKKEEPVVVKMEHDNTIYDDETSFLHKEEPRDESDIDYEIEEEEEDDDTESIVSGFSNDHNYNMSPVSTSLTSDPGYESQNSPLGPFGDDKILDLDAFWAEDMFQAPNGFDPVTDLFPSLA